MTISMVLASIGLVLVLMTDMDTLASVNQRDGLEVCYAADSGVAYATRFLAWEPDWDQVLSGGVSGVQGRSVLPARAGGQSVDAGRMTDDIQQADYGSGVWGTDTPRWRLFAHGSLSADFAESRVPDHTYLLLWVSDDIADQDGSPAADQNDVLVVRVRALGRRGSRCDVQAVVARTSTPGVVRLVSWRLVR